MTPDERDGLDEVAFGLRLVLGSLLLSVAAAVGFFCLIAATYVPRGEVHPALRSLILLVTVLASAATVYGQSYCLRVPGRARCRGYILAACLFGLAGLVLDLAPNVPALAPIGPFAAYTGLIKGAGFIAFVLFLRRLADFVDARLVADEARAVLWQSIAADFLLAAVSIGLALAVGNRAVRGIPIFLIAIAAVGLYVLFVFLRYIALLAEVRSAIDIALVETPPAELGTV